MEEFKVKKLLLGVALAGSLLLAGCESTERFWKGVDSEFGGLERKVEVVVDGEVFRTYEGKFDIKASADKIQFINSNGKLVILYRSQYDMIIVEEK
jgi:hypothetical protein